MAKLFEGDFATPAGRFAIVAARFNSAIVDALLAGALDGLKRHGVTDDAIDVARVPGGEFAGAGNGQQRPDAAAVRRWV